MLKTRFLTALVLGPLVLCAFLFGKDPFIIPFLMLCAGLCVWEAAGILIPAFEKQIGGLQAPCSKKLFWTRCISLLAMALIFYSYTSLPGRSAFGVLVVMILLLFTFGLFSANEAKLSASRAFGLIIAVLYGTTPWILIYELHHQASHSAWVVLVMGITWFGDTGGYFGGRFLGHKLFGKRKFAPSISPKKTWEGAVFGLAFGFVGALIVNTAFSGEFGSIGRILSISILGGIFAIIGDLAASSMKRFAGVKDSGIIIPGHGGFIDRVDGILFCAPIVWFITQFDHLVFS